MAIIEKSHLSNINLYSKSNNWQNMLFAAASHKCHSQNCNFKSNEPSSCGREIVGARLRKQLGNLWNSLPMIAKVGEMTAVGFEPTQLALVELESTPLDHSGKLSLSRLSIIQLHEDSSPNTSGLVVTLRSSQMARQEVN